MSKKRKLYDEATAKYHSQSPNLYCWFLDEPKDSPLYYARFLSEDHATAAAKLWDKQCKTEKYQDYTNRETWAVCLHLNNTKWLSEQSQQIVRIYKQSHLTDLANALKNMVETYHEAYYSGQIENPYNIKDLRQMFLDVGSLWRVDWEEVAEDQRAT